MERGKRSLPFLGFKVNYLNISRQCFYMTLGSFELIFWSKDISKFFYQALCAMFGFGGGELAAVGSELSAELGSWDGELLAHEAPQLSWWGTSILISWKHNDHGFTITMAVQIALVIRGVGGQKPYLRVKFFHFQQMVREACICFIKQDHPHLTLPNLTNLTKRLTKYLLWAALRPIRFSKGFQIFPNILACNDK